MKVHLLALLALLLAWPAQAQSVQSKLAASNGVVVDLDADSFADHYEYTAPLIRLDNGGGFVLVARVRNRGTLSPLEVTGSLYYSGEWRHYAGAVYRGGAAADFARLGENVVSCSGSRYGGCTLREDFTIHLSQAEVTQHAENGELQIQVRSASGDAVMLAIPVTYFDAVSEVTASPPSGASH